MQKSNSRWQMILSDNTVEIKSKMRRITNRRFSNLEENIKVKVTDNSSMFFISTLPLITRMIHLPQIAVFFTTKYHPNYHLNKLIYIKHLLNKPSVR